MTTIPTAAVCAEEKQSSGMACAEDMHGGPAAAGVVVKAAPTRSRKETPKPSADIDDPLFFAKLNLMSKKIAQDARRCKLASLAIV